MFNLFGQKAKIAFADLLVWKYAEENRRLYDNNMKLESENKVMKSKIQELEYKKYHIRCFFKAKYSDGKSNIEKPPISMRELLLENIDYLEKELEKLRGVIK